MSFSINNIGFNTLADLIAFPANFAPNAAKGILGGANSTRDGLGGIYEFDSASTATADQYYIVQQTAITGGNPGRWFRLIEFDPVTNIVPTGSMNMWGAISAPSGWLLCDGAAISRSTYAALFAIIGTTYGMGDGSTTFNVPYMRQRFPLGKASSGTGLNLGATGGAIDHVHAVDPQATNTGAPSATVTGISLLGIAGAASDTHTHSVDIAQFNSGTNNPPFLTVNYIIKT